MGPAGRCGSCEEAVGAEAEGDRPRGREGEREGTEPKGEGAEEAVTVHAMAEQDAAIGAAVARELGAVAEEQCGPEDALVSWALTRPDGDPGLEALAGLIDCLTWWAVAALGTGLGTMREE